MDPRHVLIALAVMIAVGCASSEQSVSPSTTASGAAPVTTLVSETSQPSRGSVEVPESDHREPEPTTVEPDSVEPVTTTTAARQEDDSVPIVPSAVEQTGSDSSGSDVSVEVTAGSEGAVAELLGRLEALPVQPEQRSGYDRDLFDHWVDVDGDGCDARREVLIAEAIEVPRVGSSCSLSGGRWYSRYDGATATGTGSNFDVDHLVPLAEAWDSGAHGWDSDTRRRYANDLGYAHSLVAVSASSNSAKGAADPAEWLPPEVSVRCWYAEAWIAVKSRWELSVDEAEFRALHDLVSQCDDWQLDRAPSLASTIFAPTTSTVHP